MQAVYVHQTGTANRIGYLTPYLQKWAAGVDTVFDHSAVQTGGHRHVRYVTSPGTSCTLKILVVALSANDLSSFEATTTALSGLGMSKTATKYLIWTEASVLCGVGSSYVDDSPGANNLNNGYAAQYARIDHPCWGYAEAHELMHTFGGIQSTAPHASAGGHCRDGSDQMCYPDGTSGSSPQSSTCPDAQQQWFDCGHDDYYNVRPSPGSYLATHWDSANSAFLADAWTAAS